jgi:hypothetical protein
MNDNPADPAVLPPRPGTPPPYIQQQQGPGTSPGMTRPMKAGDPVTAPAAPPMTLVDLGKLAFSVTEVFRPTKTTADPKTWIILERQDELDPRTNHRSTLTSTDPALVQLEAGHTLTFTADGTPTKETK